MKVSFFRDKLIPDCIIIYCEKFGTQYIDILKHGYACEDAGYDDCDVIDWKAIRGTFGFYLIIERVRR